MIARHGQSTRGNHAAIEQRHVKPPLDRVMMDESLLPRCVLQAAHVLGQESSGKLRSTQQQLCEMRRLLEEYMVLPPTVAATPPRIARRAGSDATSVSERAASARYAQTRVERRDGAARRASRRISMAG